MTTEFMKLVIDDSDDITSIKNQIKQKINDDIKVDVNEDNIILYELPKGTKICKRIALTTNIPSNVTQLCVELKKTVSIDSHVPVSIKSGVDSSMSSNYLSKSHIELLRPKIMRALKELEESGKSFINYGRDNGKDESINSFNTRTSHAIASSASSSGIPPPPLPGLMGTNFAANFQRNELLNIVYDSKSYEIFDVVSDRTDKQRKLWLKDKNENLIEVIMTQEGKLISIANKGKRLDNKEL